MSTRLIWRRVAENLDFPEDIAYEAVTPDGYTLGSCYLEAFGPYAYARNAAGQGFDSTAIPGTNVAEEIEAGKLVALRLLDHLRRCDRERNRTCFP